MLRIGARLGFERRAKDVTSLSDYLEKLQAEDVPETPRAADVACS
jgi:hypothetical protein